MAQIDDLVADLEVLIEASLADRPDRPLTLLEAMRHAVPGGKRSRPTLLLAITCAIVDGPLDPETRDLALRAALAIEFVHSGSLVHDDLPAFDNASTRRGRVTVHTRYSEPIAVLTGDALLNRAYEVLTAYPGPRAASALELIRLLADATGIRGIAGGQSLEYDPRYPALVNPSLHTPSVEEIEHYHGLKTAPFFSVAAESAAVLAGCSRADQRRWAVVGRDLGLILQSIDDIIDVQGGDFGKTTHRDEPLDRPNLVLAFGKEATLARIQALLDNVVRHGLGLQGFPTGVVLPLQILFQQMRKLGHPLHSVEEELGFRDRLASEA